MGSCQGANTLVGQFRGSTNAYLLETHCAYEIDSHLCLSFMNQLSVLDNSEIYLFFIIHNL